MVEFKKVAKWVVGFKDKSPDGPEAEVGIPQQPRKVFQEMNPKRGEVIAATVYPLVPVERDRPLKKLPSYLKPKKAFRKSPTFVKKKKSVRGEWK